MRIANQLRFVFIYTTSQLLWKGCKLFQRLISAVIPNRLKWQRFIQKFLLCGQGWARLENMNFLRASSRYTTHSVNLKGSFPSLTAKGPMPRSGAVKSKQIRFCPRLLRAHPSIPLSLCSSEISQRLTSQKNIRRKLSDCQSWSIQRHARASWRRILPLISDTVSVGLKLRKFGFTCLELSVAARGSSVYES